MNLDVNTLFLVTIYVEAILGLLLLFAWIQNALVVYSFVSMMSIVPNALDPYLLAIGVFEAVGLGAMFWSASR